MGVVKHSLSREELSDALKKAGGVVAHAARSLGIPRSTFRDILAKNEGLEAVAPPGFSIRGVSVLEGPDGEVKQRWVKTQKDTQNLDALQDALEARFQGVRARPLVRCPKAPKSPLLTAYPLGDPHVGMLAWGKESGEDFDLKIAVDTLIAATTRLVHVAPPGPALIAQLGDFFHADSQAQKTERSGHKLDVDSRYGKILEVGVDLMCTLIDLALKKHTKIRVINARGNHDPHSAMVLTIALKHHYRKNKRVSFGEPSKFFHYHQYGETLIGVTHGDGPKPEALGSIMATDKPKLWGDTRHRYWLTGHIHTRKVYELPGCMVESFRTLAAKDAWTAQMGYRSGRDQQILVFHKEHGEVERHRVDIGQVS